MIDPSKVSSDGSMPFVSVIMPVYNEGGFIEKSITALLAQSYPHDNFEIIIADGRSTDNTRDIIELISASSPIPILLVDNPGRTAPCGLNRALELSNGSIIIRIDGHCEVEADYISNCVRHLRNKTAEGVGGPIETVGETVQAVAISLAMSSKFGVGNSAFRTTDGREMYVDTVAFPGYTREIVERAGAFDEELVRNQDDEYNFRIREMGGRILLAPDIRSRYYSRSSLASLWRQYFQYGYWKVRVFQLHPRQMSVRQFVPPLFIVGMIILGVMAIFSELGRTLLVVSAAAYLLANFTASVFVAARHLAALPLLPVCFAILHFSYGIGFLKGLISFRSRWRERSQLPVRAN